MLAMIEAKEKQPPRSDVGYDAQAWIITSAQPNIPDMQQSCPKNPLRLFTSLLF